MDPHTPRTSSLADVTFCVLDLETTGCDAGVDAITEIGAVKVRGGEHLGTFHTLVNARQSIPTFIAVLTGISSSMLADAPAIDAVLPSLAEFVRGCVIVGHNVRFDLRFLNAALDAGMYERIGADAVDTVPLARRLLGEDVADCRLSTLAAALGLGHLPTHHAFDDASATVELLHVLIERATGFGVLTLDDLLELPRVGRHPYAAKLPLTNHLHRAPGVFVFHGGRDEVLHVGRATDIRRQVRRYFASRDRRRIAPLLREARRVSALVIDDPLAAEIVELRLVQRHRPRYDRAAVRAAGAVCYVHLDPRCRRRPSIVREPRAGGLHLGPLPTRVMAELTLHALHTLGDAGAVEAVTGAPGAGLDHLRHQAGEHAVDAASAARLGAASRALAGALARQRLFDSARGHGSAVLSTAARTVAIDHGLVGGIGGPGALPVPLAVPASGPPDWAGTDRPLPRWAAAEVLRVARRLRLAET